jgi:hypothetical protein
MRVRLLPFVLLCASSALAQETGAVSPGFDKAVHSCSQAESVIAVERKRLGSQFEKGLLAYLGEDVDKHYWMACALSGCCRETNDRSLESLSLLVMHQGLSLLRNKTDEDSLYPTVSFRILAAIQSELLGFHPLAIAHKSEAESLMRAKPILKGGFPAMSKREYEVYDSLPIRPVPSQSSPKRTIKKSKR